MSEIHFVWNNTECRIVAVAFSYLEDAVAAATVGVHSSVSHCAVDVGLPHYRKELLCVLHLAKCQSGDLLVSHLDYDGRKQIAYFLQKCNSRSRSRDSSKLQLPPVEPPPPAPVGWVRATKQASRPHGTRDHCPTSSVIRCCFTSLASPRQLFDWLFRRSKTFSLYTSM